MKQRESRLSGKIIDALRQQGVFAWKQHADEYTPAGLPDIIACVDGKFVGMETKLPHERANVSTRQVYMHERIRKSGGIVGVVCSVGEALNLVDRVRNPRD